MCLRNRGESRGKGNLPVRMSKLKDPGIKLFGKTISLPQNNFSLSSAHLDHHDDCQSSSNAAASEDNKNTLGEELTETKQEDDLSNPTAEESIQPASVSGITDDDKTSSAENETLSPKDTKNEELCDNNSSQEKTLKKPDKILPCPRCNSMDTKFCYDNNYNVNQPRHLCKNCQRYWTAGGTMRNMPVGSGCRKNKNTCPSNYHYIMVSDALQAARGDGANGLNLPTLKVNGAVLTFGFERPICESMANVLNLAQRPHNLPNGFHALKQRFAVPCGGREIAKDHSTVSSTKIPNSKVKGVSAELVSNNCHGHLLAVRLFSGPPWPYPWNSAQWRSLLSLPVLRRPGFLMSFYPTPPFWSSAAPNPRNMPWLSTASLSPDHSAQSTSPTSPTLGKHARDENILSLPNLLKEEDPFDRKNVESSIMILKTLRIGDPNEAAKSSIWSTLGIKNDKIDSINMVSLFKAFPLKGDGKNDVADTSLVLQANPVAFSWSQSFCEST